MRAVAITGLGALSPFGAGAIPLWQGVLSKRSIIAPITRFDAATFLCRIAGEVNDSLITPYLPPHKSRTLAHSTRMMHVAAQLAIEDASLEAAIEKHRAGVVLGTALGGWRDGEQQSLLLRERGTGRVNQFLVSGAGCFAAASHVSEMLGAQGEHLTISNGCPSALQAIATGAGKVASGELDWCLVGGTESPLSPTIVAALARSGELSPETVNPGAASAPFDKNHRGMVLSEGASALLLEPLEQAVERRAKIYAIVTGGASSCDSAGLYSSDESGEPGASALHSLLHRKNLTANDIDYVCAHANSSPIFDRKETSVLRRALGEFAARIPVSSIKGALGHPFGASGAFQTLIAALAMTHEAIPPTANLEDPDPECELDLVMGEPRKKTIRHALVTSYGYGGVNAYLLLRNPNL